MRPDSCQQSKWGQTLLHPHRSVCTVTQAQRDLCSSLPPTLSLSGSEGTYVGGAALVLWRHNRPNTHVAACARDFLSILHTLNHLVFTAIL